MEKTAEDETETAVCCECGSIFRKSSSKMKELCPECASVLYGYESCTHVFRDGRCIRCLWDGSRSAFIRKLRNENDKA